MDIEVHVNASEPVYEQIVRQIHDAVKSGRLRPDAPLPTVRQLADDLRLNRNTVARAYKLLEDQGVILTAGRKGTFVRYEAAKEIEKVKAGRADRLMRRLIKTLMLEGMTRREISDIFNSALSVETRKG